MSMPSPVAPCYTEREAYAAIRAWFDQLPPTQRMALTYAVNIIKTDIPGLGEMSAKEVLYQIGRLINESKSHR